ncbi:hypothetical protein HZR84_06045 [Hyphobacterium sp. CCMP332]|nr:hypothetical protein HZR84_06045 [Hyphobacterium sp. CCMP332]
MKRLIVLTFALSLFGSHNLQAQSPFPDIAGITLEDNSMTIPKDFNGKKTIVGLAFSKKSDEDLRSWFEPAYRTFIDPPKNSLIPVTDYDVNIIFIPMLKGAAKAASGKIVKKMKEGIDPRLHSYILVYEGSINDYKEVLNFGAKDVPYFFILDEEGNILHNTSGEYSDEKFDEITKLLEE